MVKIGTIKLNFTPKYEGTHRICWRTVETTDYTCEEIQCKSLECDCEYIISVSVEVPDTVQVEGYIQPTCEDVTSLNNRIPFTSSLI